jgi:Protein of unknown function (DUF4239)
MTSQVTFATSIIWTVLVVAASIGGLLLLRRWMLAADLKTQHDITDPYSQVVGMMFAVLLGFMVGDAMQRFSNARATVQQEAASLADVFRLAEGMPDADRDKLQVLCLQYAKQVVTDEWPLMANKKTSEKVWQTYKELWTVSVDYQPKSQAQSNVQQTMLPVMVTLSDNRRLRIEALHNGLPAALWYVLVIGGLATIVFTYFFGAHNVKIQMVMVAIVSLVICLNIFLLASYDDPFSGDVIVHPSSFETDIEMFSADIKNNAPAHSR